MYLVTRVEPAAATPSLLPPLTLPLPLPLPHWFS